MYTISEPPEIYPQQPRCFQDFIISTHETRAAITASFMVYNYLFRVTETFVWRLMMGVVGSKSTDGCDKSKREILMRLLKKGKDLDQITCRL